MKKNMLVMAALLFASTAFAAEPVVMKVSSSAKEDSPRGQAINKFKELAEKYTNGKVKIEVGHSGAFAEQPEELTALKQNRIQMTVTATSSMDELYKNTDANPFVALDVPYLFKDAKQFAAFADSKLAEDMGQTAVAGGAKVLGFWDNGLKLLSTNKALNTPSDLKGVSFKVQPSPVIYRQFKMWGAHPRELEVNDMYTATMYGSVDGTENPASNFTANKLYETQKYLYKSGHGFHAYVVLVNNKFWSTLPADVRTGMTKAFKESTTVERTLAKRDNEFALQRAIETSLVRVLPMPAELDKFMRERAPLAEAALSETQKEWYEKLKKATK